MGDQEQVDAGTVGIGTPRYMAPEVFAGGTVSARSDVFSLAATLWTLLTGKPPVYGDPAKLVDMVPGVSPGLEQCVRDGLELLPERRTSSCAAFAHALGRPLAEQRGESLVETAVDRADVDVQMLSAIVKTSAGVFEAAACSIALVDPVTSELVYQASWGAGAKEIVGVRLPAGKGLAGSVVETGEALAVPDCRNDERFQAQIAAGTGYVPYTMLVVPLRSGAAVIGTLSVLDRRDGNPYTTDDIPRGNLFAELTVTALGIGAVGHAAAPPPADGPSLADQGTVVG
jgi:eukaryotic-like serine/threonine-protein kinase